MTIEGKHRWLVTGAAGFIGSHLVDTLLEAGQDVIAMDPAFRLAKGVIGEPVTSNHFVLKADIRETALLQRYCYGVDYILHNAGLCSVAESHLAPTLYHEVNVNGFLYVLEAARLAKVKRIVYASTAAIYATGDYPTPTERIPGMKSPYAASKLINELYAKTYSDIYGLQTIGLRYFNVFGPRQNPSKAVIPQWIDNMIHKRPCIINGDGRTRRDFVYISNVVRANIRAALTDNPRAVNQVYQIGSGKNYSLGGLYEKIRAKFPADAPIPAPVYVGERPHDIRFSKAKISSAEFHLGYEVVERLDEGLDKTIEWYAANK